VDNPAAITAQPMGRRGTHMRKLIGALAVAVALGTPAAAMAASIPLAADNQGAGGHALGYRPAQIVYSGDGTAFLAGQGTSARHPGRLRWTTWSTTRALGYGATWMDNCKPNCAAGTYFSYPSNVRLYRPRVLGGHLVFTRMTVTFPATRPPYPAYRSGSWTASLRYVSMYGSGYLWM
jgi:hypothetical protein